MVKYKIKIISIAMSQWLSKYSNTVRTDHYHFIQILICIIIYNHRFLYSIEVCDFNPNILKKNTKILK